MNIEQTKEAIMVMQAFVDGKPCEWRCRGLTIWKEIGTPSWDFVKNEYRNKPQEVFPCTIEILSGPDKGKIFSDVKHEELPTNTAFKILPQEEQRKPKEIWVNEYENGDLGGCHASREDALRYARQLLPRRTVRYREIME